jgi:glycosyltransferase involved in cell wall biosynthesis
MLSRPPRVSIVLPTRDRQTLLGEALASLEWQHYPDWEVIVVDDASTPSVDFSRLVRPHPKLRGVRHGSPLGGAAGKNSGLAVARGEILAFLDDDDL